MADNYPSFDRLEIRKEYTDKINGIFYRDNLPWTASSSIIHPQVFVRPKDSYHWSKFQNVSRMSLHTIDGIMRFGVKGKYSPDKAPYKETLMKNKGYSFQQNPDSENDWWLIKPIDLGEIVREIRDIEPILLKKKN
ncbi:MAG: hypothetical protein NTZ83_00740 [Candidatus Pacearchaeota archaeon]|nr:hypothetical protein [Candidatus Pacearchaeota archaeon]